MRYRVLLLMVLFTPPSWAEEAISLKSCDSEYTAKLVSLQGSLFFDPESKGQWQLAELNQKICEGSRIRTETYSRASIALPNGIILKLDQNTVISLNGFAPQKKTLMDMAKGFVHFISRTPTQLQITTPIANAGPEGTEFTLSVDDQKASLWVYEGGVKFFNAKGDLHLKPGESAITQLGQAPRSQIDLRPQDAVNWALYYPPILPYPDTNVIIDPQVRAAIDNYRQGNAVRALTSLDQLEVSQRNAYFYKVRAAIRLSVGRVDLAQQDIQAILALNTNDAEANALKSMLALTQNRKEEAYSLAKQAIAANPQSASAYSALSYAEQGRFELNKALSAAQQAVKLAPNDAMTWARQAELELSLGETAISKQTALRALGIDANLERTQTITGFAYLLRMDTDEALQAFKKATLLDSSAPLARLGLGLAKIRNGDLAEGRQDLEIAGILDPNNSLIRSYLGKAYYEEKRNRLAEDQFDLAKLRDPKDPTPWFYDAIKKQTENRPVEALGELQNAMKLNDNRAVYRSKQALDSDLAARGAALGRIYSDLGFSQRALIEGWQATNTDPSSFSAHRFLSDNYAALPQHQIARVSELLQSQLLQPINVTPIQPHLAESNLTLLSGSGPSRFSFNEFNPIFHRNGIAMQSTGLAGSLDTFGDEVVVSGIKDNLSYSLGQLHYQSNGFRANNSLKEDIYNGFIQANLLPNLGIQFEARHKESQRGDLAFNFDLNKPDVDMHKRFRSDLVRVGSLFKPRENLNILGSIMYLNSYENDEDGINSNSNGVLGEGQLIYKTELGHVILGGGYYNSSSKDTYNGKYSDTHGNVYAYDYIQFPKNITWTIGASFDSTRAAFSKDERFSPKAGLVWKISENTSLRGAFFRTLKRPLLNDQTIEPTNVAGFNQLYDDYNGTDTEKYGIALDHRFNSDTFSGIELSRRLLKVPGEDLPNKAKREERVYRAYVHWAPLDSLALTANYEFENYLEDGLTFTTTHSGYTGLRYFHPSGITARIQVTGIDQTVRDGHDSFALLDIGIGYRLPKRYGVVSFQVNNLLNQNFYYQDRNMRVAHFSDQPQFFPVRTFSAQLTLSIF